MPCMGDPDDLDDGPLIIKMRRRDRVVVWIAKFIGLLLIVVAFLALVALGVAREVLIWSK